MNIQKEIDDLLAQRASQWVDILRTGRPEDLPEFVKWVGESPRNLDEFLTMAALDQALEGTELYARFDRNAVLSQSAPPTSARRSLFKAAPQRSARRSRRTKWMSLVAACFCALTVAVVAWRITISPSHTYLTRTGEQQSVDLPDGSVMHLNAQSRVQIRFDESQRELVLSDGEAIFKVAHDGHRPFEVRTPQAVVKALGTEFNVRARPETGTHVAVLEGRVQIASVKQPLEPPQALDQGEEARVASVGTIKVSSHADVARVVAWRQRRLVFAQTALEDIVREFNRFNRVQLRLQQVPADSHHYSGTFDADDLKALTTYLAKEQDLQVEPRGQEILIRGRSNSANDDPVR